MCDRCRTREIPDCRQGLHHGLNDQEAIFYRIYGLCDDILLQIRLV